VLYYDKIASSNLCFIILRKLAFNLMKYLHLTKLLVIIGIILISTSSNVKASANIEKHVLSNGLTLILNEQHSRKIISLCLLVDGGARIENPDVSGITHFIEHLVFRGPTENQEEMELRRSFRLLGNFTGYTTCDYTCYGFTTNPESFDVALDEFVDGVMNLTIPDSVIEKERSVVTREIHQRGDIPNIRLWELFYATALKVHSYRHPVIGYEDLIRDLDNDIIRDYYHEHYKPDHLVIAITGDFDSRKMVSRLEGAFSAYESSGMDFERGMNDPAQTEIRSQVEKADISFISCMMGYRIPPAKETSSPSLEVLAEILGGGEDSKLYKTLKTNSNLVDEIYCFTNLNHDDGFFILYVIAPEENLDEIREITLQQIAGIIENPPSDNEIKRAKQRIKNDYSFNLQTYWDISEHLATWEIYGNLEQGFNWVDLIKNVTQSDLVDAASTYLKPDCHTWVALVPQEKQEKPKLADAAFDEKSPVHEIKPGEVVATNLPNSAKLIFKCDTASDIIGISVLAGMGQVMEDENQRGIGEFTARMLLKGCANLDSTEFRKKSEELGCRITSSGDRDFIKILFEIHKDNLLDGIELLSNVLFKPSFDEDEIELVRGELVAEIQRRNSGSFSLANDGFFTQVYGDTPYGCPVAGTEDAIESITVDDLHKFHSLAFAPKNMTIAVVGDLDFTKSKPGFDRLLGRLVRTVRLDENRNFDYPVNEIPAMMNEEKILDLPRSQVSFNMGLIGVPANNPDYPALKMLVRVLGLRLFDKYVYELGWSYRMWFYMPTRRGPSPIMFEMGVETDKFKLARDGLVESMRDIIENPVSDEEFAKTIGCQLQSFHLAMQKNIDMAEYLAFFDKVGLGYEHVLNYDEIYSSLTPLDLSIVANKYFHPDGMKLFAIVPDEK